MSQKGLIFIPILIGTLIIVAVAGFIYFQQKLIGQLPTFENKEASFSANLDINQTFEENLSNTNSPAPSATSNKSTNKQSTPTPSPTSTSSTKTSTPTPTPTSTTKKNTCEVSVIYGKLLGGASDPLLVTLVYSYYSHNSAYMTGAQWDFDGNGTWDTDLKQSNGDIEHTYPKSGTYTPRLQLQGSDGSMTDVCAKQVTIDNGLAVQLSGQVFKDLNCNSTKDTGEDGLSGKKLSVLNAQGIAYTDVTTDNNGYYSFSKNIRVNDSLTLQLSPVNFAFNFISPTSVTLDSLNPSATINVSLCSNF